MVSPAQVRVLLPTNLEETEVSNGFMTDPANKALDIDLTKITRFELIDLNRQDARVWLGGPPYDKTPIDIAASVQDDGRTLKIFVKRNK